MVPLAAPVVVPRGPTLAGPASLCVAAVLGDAQRRLSVAGGREGMPRSLGSVYGGSVTRFLGGSLRGIVRRDIATRGVVSFGVAVSRDGSTLLVSDGDGGSQAIHEYSVADASRLRVIGGKGDGPLQFYGPSQVWVASDDFVFVAECHNKRVQVLTPRLDFHGFIGEGRLAQPLGVCANADVVVVSDTVPAHCVAVFSRHDGALLRRFGSYGIGDGHLRFPQAVCFVCGDRHVAVLDGGNDRVSVFSVGGEFVRHVGVGVLRSPHGVACSGYDELVVADSANHRIAVFSDSGDLHMTIAWSTSRGTCTSFAVHDGAVFAQDRGNTLCVVFE